jgi:hypothetical protein
MQDNNLNPKNIASLVMFDKFEVEDWLKLSALKTDSHVVYGWCYRINKEFIKLSLKDYSPDNLPMLRDYLTKLLASDIEDNKGKLMALATRLSTATNDLVHINSYYDNFLTNLFNNMCINLINSSVKIDSFSEDIKDVIAMVNNNELPEEFDSVLNAMIDVINDIVRILKEQPEWILELLEEYSVPVESGVVLPNLLPTNELNILITKTQNITMQRELINSTLSYGTTIVDNASFEFSGAVVNILNKIAEDTNNFGASRSAYIYVENDDGVFFKFKIYYPFVSQDHFIITVVA